MKKHDFKIDFTKRDVISLVCFTFVMVLVLVLGNTFGYVSAETVTAPSEGGGSGSADDVSWLNWQDYITSDCYSSDNLYVAYMDLSSQTAVNNALVGCSDILDFDFSSIANTPSGFNYDDITNYLIIGNAYPSAFVVYLWHGGENSFVYYNNDSRSWIIITDVNGNGNSKIYSCTFTPYGDGTNMQSVTPPDTLNWEWSSYYSEVGTDFYGVLGSSAIPYICASNCEIRTTTTGKNVAYECQKYILGQENDSVNVNYMFGNAKGLTGFDNLTGIGSDIIDEDGENSSNNLYLNSPYWSFNMPHNNQLTSSNGTATFNAVSTDYQNEHPDEFELHYWFQIDVTYTFPDSGDGGFSGAGHGFCILNSIQPTKSLGTTVTRSRTGIFKYRYDGSDSAVCPFSDFDGSQTFQTITVGTGWNKLFRLCYLSGNTSYNTFYDWWKDYGRTTPTDNESLPTVTDAKLKCYAQLYDDTSSSGICAYYYDFLTGESGVLDDSLGVNTNPYDFDTQDQYSNQSSGYGYVVQNNNQSVNITNNVSSDVQNEIANIITGVDDSDSSNWVSTLTSLLQANAFLSFMSTTFGFIPSAFWTALSTFFITCLAFLTGFVLLRVLLDLL